MILTINNVKEVFTKKNPIVKSRVYGKNTINKYTLINAISIQLTDGKVITIPKGFEWDLASVPKFLWWLMSPDVDSEIAYLIHDYLYINQTLPRKEADLEMYKWAVVTNGTKNKLSARNIDNWLRWKAVVLFGNSVYKKNKK
jgi:hypothetical protein